MVDIGQASQRIEGIQLNKLSTRCIKEKRWIGGCGGSPQSPEDIESTCRSGHTPKQTLWLGLGLAVETELSRPLGRRGARLPVVPGPRLGSCLLAQPQVAGLIIPLLAV